MWVVNVIIIFAAIAFISWLLWSYRQELSQALGILLSSCQFILLAIGVILIEAIKAAIVAALVGGAFGLIFFLIRAPEQTTKTVAISLATLTFALLMLKVLWENLNNLRWSIRNEIRNRYRRR